MKILKRTLLNQKLKKYANHPVLIANAPSGFGKTTCIDTFLNQENANHVWLSMYGECDETWAWEKLMNLLRTLYPAFEYNASIPTSRKSIDEFMDALSAQIEKPLFIVIDDVLTAKIPTYMQMLTTYSYDFTKGIYFILITMDSTDSICSYAFSKECLPLSVHDFTFTTHEIQQLCKNEGLHLSQQEIEKIYQHTDGWIIAIQLILEAYRNTENIYNHSDIHRLIKRVLFHKLSTSVQQDFMKLSLLKGFTIELIHNLCEDTSTLEKIIQLEEEHFFIRKSVSQTYTFIPLFKEFLMELPELALLDKHAVFLNAGDYYFLQNNPLEAIYYYLQCDAFAKIMQVFEKYKDISFADISPQLILQVFEQLPDSYKNEYPYIYLEFILDSITNFPQINGVQLLEDFKSRVDNNIIKGDASQLYGEYFFIHAFTYYNDVMKMIADFKQAYHYFKGGYSKFAFPFMIATFGSYHMLFLYYNKWGQLKEITTFIKKNAHYFIHISSHINEGCIHQIEAEYNYEIGAYDNVLAFALAAYQEAMGHQQFSIAISSLFLQGRLALFQNNGKEYHAIVERLQEFYTKCTGPILHCEIDCALSHLYILNNSYEKVPDWIKGRNYEDSTILHEANMIVHIVHGLCLIKERNSSGLKIVYEVIESCDKQQVHIYALLYASLFKTIYHYENNRLKNALDCLKNTIKLCEKDHIITPILELSFAFPKIINLYVPQSKYELYVLKQLKNKISTLPQPFTHQLPLSPKEKQILSCYAQNASAKDIANTLNISINTVQTHMKSIYKKLNINTKIEAIRYYENNK